MLALIDANYYIIHKMVTFFFTCPPAVCATEIVLVEGPVMMKDEKSSLNCKRKKLYIFSPGLSYSKGLSKNLPDKHFDHICKS